MGFEYFLSLFETLMDTLDNVFRGLGGVIDG